MLTAKRYKEVNVYVKKGQTLQRKAMVSSISMKSGIEKMEE